MEFVDQSNQNQSKWILVYNVRQDTLLPALNALSQFGQIARYYRPVGNVVFVKFQLPLSAEVAAMRRSINVTESITIGISEVTGAFMNRFPVLRQMSQEENGEKPISVYPVEKQPRKQKGILQALKDLLFA